MFSVMFEVHPKPEQWDAYLGYAQELRPQLERIDGFVDNIRYASLRREGWILSLSGWQGEKPLVRWRTQMRHHEVQQKGRFEVFLDYHLRVGQLTADTRLPGGCEILEQRLDETETGEGTTAVLIDAHPPDTHLSDMLAGEQPAQRVAWWLGLRPEGYGLAFWDVYDAVLAPGDLILQTTWRDQAAADAFVRSAELPDGARVRQVRIIRDYGMYDRREAPQYYAAVERPAPDRGDR